LGKDGLSAGVLLISRDCLNFYSQVTPVISQKEPAPLEPRFLCFAFAEIARTNVFTPTPALFGYALFERPLYNTVVGFSSALES